MLYFQHTGGTSDFLCKLAEVSWKSSIGDGFQFLWGQGAKATGLELSDISDFDVLCEQLNEAGKKIGLNQESIKALVDGAVLLHHSGNQKLTTTINGIEVPDLNVTGVGTVGRLDTDGVVLGTNGTTFAAKFADNAVANFGDDGDLKIYHDSVVSDFTIAIHWVKNIKNSGFVELDNRGKVNKFIEKPKIDNITGGWVNSGLYIINPGVINALIKEKSDFSYDIIPWLVRRKKNIYGYRIKNKLWAIDTPDLFFKAKNELNII